MDLLEKIIATEDYLRSLNKQYTEDTPPCCSKDCNYYSSDYSLNCKWTNHVTGCEDYTEDE